MHRSPYTTEQVAQARQVVTNFDAILRDNGAVEADELIKTAWEILLADAAALRAGRRFTKLQQYLTPGDAA